MPRFSVDTHVFRELGELLVGRDSTALVELVKNAYDADATEVVVYGEKLDQRGRGRIVITDNGNGMTSDVFEMGFLRVASRLKEEGERRSPRFHRRFTGAKGIGRLAAHKLASHLEVTSTPWNAIETGDRKILHAVIDWNEIERYQTLDDVGDKAVRVDASPAKSGAESGTTISLQRLRRAWTPHERTRFFNEVQSFDAPVFLREELPRSVVGDSLLFAKPHVRESAKSGSHFEVRLEGDFAAGEDYWQLVAEAASWIIEIRASKSGTVKYSVAPTKRARLENLGAERVDLELKHPAPETGPFFDARILVREGQFKASDDQRVWASKASGIRVYLEGFRVLPYGDQRDDWLSIDADYTRRRRQLELLREWEDSGRLPPAEEDEGLSRIPNNNYIGAVFLRHTDAPTLRTLVNREGFVPDAAFDTIVHLVRTGIDLATRVRAAASFVSRKRRKETRSAPQAAAAAPPALRTQLQDATEELQKARQDLSKGDVAGAKSSTAAAAQRLADLTEALISEQALLRVVASVGTQMAAFVHEIRSLLGTAQTIEQALADLGESQELSALERKRLRSAHGAIVDLRRGLERQASYLTDVITPDARRRRSRQRFAERFESATRLVLHEAERRGVQIRNDLDQELKSPPMFSAEVTTIFANLLTNAVKGAGKGGIIRATSKTDKDGRSRVRIENTGAAVKLAEAERWFRPFESTTTDVDPVLGQGMGLGLPITRSILTDYGATIQFVKPFVPFSTAVEIAFPE